MAQLFVSVDCDPVTHGSLQFDTRLPAPAASQWQVAPLDDSPVELIAAESGKGCALRPRRPQSPPGTVNAPLLVRAVADQETWVVVHAADGGLRVNGRPLTTGIRVLRHRDELRLAGAQGRVFFSLERLCRVAPFDGDAEARCPRCQMLVDSGTEAVRCVCCGVVYHQNSTQPCWSYGPQCVTCTQPTDLSAGFQWIPTEPRHG